MRSFVHFLGLLKMSADQLQRLPVNQYQLPSPQETRIMTTMLGGSLCNSPIKFIISGVVFFVLNLPFVDKFLKDKISASDMVILAVKTGLFLVVLMLTQLMGW